MATKRKHLEITLKKIKSFELEKWKSTKDAAAKCSVPGSSHLTWNEKNEWKINDSFITKSKKSKSLYLEKKLTKSC